MTTCLSKAGEMVSQHLEEADGLMGAWDILFSGLEGVSTEKIEISASDDAEYQLTFTDGSGNEVEVPLGLHIYWANQSPFRWTC